MTPQEATNNLKKYENSLVLPSEVLESVKLAIEALRKQIPIRPYYEADGYDENENLIYDHANCPNCNRDFEYDINDWGCDYCSDCGQRLDWSDSDE